MDKLYNYDGDDGDEDDDDAKEILFAWPELVPDI